MKLFQEGSFRIHGRIIIVFALVLVLLQACMMTALYRAGEQNKKTHRALQALKETNKMLEVIVEHLLNDTNPCLNLTRIQHLHQLVKGPQHKVIKDRKNGSAGEASHSGPKILFLSSSESVPGTTNLTNTRTAVERKKENKRHFREKENKRYHINMQSDPNKTKEDTHANTCHNYSSKTPVERSELNLLASPLEEQLTVIMATSPRPAGECILHVRTTLLSLYRQLPELFPVTLRIAFDGCPVGQPKFWEATWCEDYKMQKRAISDFIKKELSNASIAMDYVVPDTTRAGLGGNLRNSFEHVHTPYVYVIQDDFVHNMPFDIGQVLDTLQANAAIQYIRLNVLKNGHTGMWDYKSDEKIIGNGLHCVARGLTRGCNWSDNNHFVRTKEYIELLMAMPMPDKAPESHFNHSIKDCDAQMRWYLYGAMGHGPMVCHVDGMYRNWNRGANGPQKRKCPTQDEYIEYVAKMCPKSGLS